MFLLPECCCLSYWAVQPAAANTMLQNQVSCKEQYLCTVQKYAVASVGCEFNILNHRLPGKISVFSQEKTWKRVYPRVNRRINILLDNIDRVKYDKWEFYALSVIEWLLIKNSVKVFFG